MKRQFIKILFSLAAIFPVAAFAAGPKVPAEIKHPYAIAMISIAALLLFAIILVAQLLMLQAKNKLAEEKKNSAAKILPVLLCCLISPGLFAQDAAADAAATTEKVAVAVQLSNTSFYVMIAVIVVELIILLGLISQLRALMIVPEATALLNEAGEKITVQKEPYWKKLWEKANSFRPVKEEAEIDLGHDYDGIRELDNRLPPWWLYGFFITIIFSGIYLWRYHVTHTAPSSLEELQVAMKIAAEEKEVFLAKSKSNVDENTVTLLTDAADIEAGKKVFTTMCAACHAADGGGNAVGPNLTDNYWLHGGSVQDVFKTIKYGWPEKGMRSWKDDYSPIQISQITSFVKSLHGTKPAAPKEPQGELYEETGNAAKAADSTAAPAEKVTAGAK